MSEQSAFEPGKYLTKVSGREYLEVKWRLVWLRTEHPNAQIDTELVEHENRLAIFRARVTLPSGASASGWGSEGADDFGDYLEKAETKAIGRALAALGYGTQFCPDFDFGAEQQRVVDSPVDIRAVKGQRGGQQPAQQATPRQIRYLQSVAREAGMDFDDLETRTRQSFGVALNDLSRRDASTLIEQIQAERPVQNLAS